MDPDETATSFIEYVYSHPGQPPEEYAVRLADEMRALVAAEREACVKIADERFHRADIHPMRRLEAMDIRDAIQARGGAE